MCIKYYFIYIRGGQKLLIRPEFDQTEKEFDCWVLVGRVMGWPGEKKGFNR
jgi:hypothetical protein